jgi:DNA-binding transcriptional regulator YiaG
MSANGSAREKRFMTTSPRSGEHRLAKAKRIRPRRDFQAMEERRMRAAEMFAAGAISQADIGRNLGVSHQTVSDWHSVWRRG